MSESPSTIPHPSPPIASPPIASSPIASPPIQSPHIAAPPPQSSSSDDKVPVLPPSNATPGKVIIDLKSPNSVQKRDEGKRVIVAPTRQYDLFNQAPKVKSKSNNKRKVDALLTGQKKKKIEEYEKEIEESNKKISNLTQQRTRIQKSLDESIKFPCKDELIKEYDKTGTSIKPLPKSAAVIKFPEDIISELIGVWEFLNIFKIQLNLIPIGIDQFADLLRYTGRASVALTEIFISPLRMLLTDPTVLQQINDAIPKKASIAVKPNKDINIDFDSFVSSNEISGWDGSGNFDIGYNGISLLPPKIHPDQIDPLKWQAILRSVLLRLEPVKNLRLGHSDITTHHNSIFSVVEGKYVELSSLKKNLSSENLVNLNTNNDNLKTISELAVTGGESRHRTFPYNKDTLLKISSDVVVPLNNLKEAALELESKELHELSPRLKLAILKNLCESCFETQHLKELLENNAEERAIRMTHQRKIESEKILKKKEISKEKKEEAIARCRKFNKATMPAPKSLSEVEFKQKQGAKKTGPGSRGGNSYKASKDIWEPKQDQLNAMIEEMTLLENLGVDDVFDYLPEDILEEIDEEENDETTSALYADDGTILRRSRASIRSDAAEKKKRNQEVLIYNNNLHMVQDQIRNAISIGSEKELRLSIKAGLKAGLRIEGEDGTVSIHESLRDAYKLQKEIIAKQEEEKITAAHEKSLEQFLLRTSCLGTDRNHNSYWVFNGDNERLFVQEKMLLDASLDKNGKQISKIAKAFSQNNKNFGQIYSSRPNKYKYKWVIYSTERELWDLYDALDNRGEREYSLKSAIKSRFELDEPPIVYLNTGSDYIGRKVRRQFGRKKPIIGTVTGWAPQVKYDPAIWHIVHDDGN
jgi:hypothetical protein